MIANVNKPHAYVRSDAGPWCIFCGYRKKNRRHDVVAFSRKEYDKLLVEREQFEEVLGNVWLYIDWNYVTHRLTTEQRTLFADSVDASTKRLHGDDFEGPVADRWWES